MHGCAVLIVSTLRSKKFDRIGYEGVRIIVALGYSNQRRYRVSEAATLVNGFRRACAAQFNE